MNFLISPAWVLVGSLLCSLCHENIMIFYDAHNSGEFYKSWLSAGSFFFF